MFKNTISNLTRIRQVAEVLLRYGFEDVVTTTPLRRLVSQSRRLSKINYHRQNMQPSRMNGAKGRKLKHVLPHWNASSKRRSSSLCRSSKFQSFGITRTPTSVSALNSLATS